jgi:hypothetical protein
VVLHVGLPKTGTTFLQGVLAEHRDRLRAAGALYPFIGPAGMFRGAVEVRGSHEKFGLAAEEVAGTWRALCERAHGFDGTTVISHEVLAGATLDQVRAALEPLGGLPVDVVVTARDLGRQATAHWQEEVKLGDTWSFADLERRQLRADTGPDEGPDAGGRRPHFWHAQDFADALRRWSSVLPPERVHLVVCPAPGAPPGELWRRFAEAAGLDGDLVPDDELGTDAANRSLGTLQVALLRAVNAELAGRLDPRTYNRVVKKGYAERVLAAEPGSRPRTPYALGEVLEPATRAWLADVGGRGHPVHGDPAELLPVLGAPGDPWPDDVDPAELAARRPDEVARTLLAQAETEETPDTSRRAVGRLRGLVSRRTRGPDA